ncbi:IclR family transcriptional regulator [Streptomyces tagetis]|uniref:Helix-turn-helix domain-containing protein n=1 Tax=Streptomyces tagetis TaxID=2820809 RepID=A0A940XMQ1_9ACTN|nr:helix-turn-helix domain-containing protein [Streptomyces sp. RG38]MBQ0826538.1 helix-turn-helix domain-containing protein [Streptomyces sp. RG38]
MSGASRKPSAHGVETPTGDIQVIARTVQLLRRLNEDGAIDLAHAAKELGVGKSTAHRYLASMETHGLLQRLDRVRYEVGPLLAELGITALTRLGVVDLARPVMEELSHRVRHTVVLSIWNGHAPVVAEVHEDASRTAHVSIRRGSTLRPNTAQAALFAAYPDKCYHRPGGPVTALTEAETAAIHRTCVSVRTSDEEGVRAVATPVWGGSGRLVASLAVVGIAQLVPEEDDSPVAQALTAAAATLQRELTDPLVHDVESG